MSRPGERLRRLCGRWFDADAMEHVADPIVADLQSEYAEARRQGRPLQAPIVLVVGYAALLKALVFHEWIQAADLLTDWTADDHRTLRRTIVWIGAATILVMLLLALRPSMDMVKALGTPGLQRLFLLFPQALVIAIPFGLALGTAIGLGGLRVSTRLGHLVLCAGLLSSVLSFVTISWATAAANQAWRESFPLDEKKPFTSLLRTGEPAVNELTLPQMAHVLAVERRSDPTDSRTRSLARRYYTRLGLCFASFSLAVMLLAVVSRCAAGRLTAVLTGVGAPFGYYAVLALVTNLTRSGSMQFLIAWLPNVVVIVLAVVTVRLLPAPPETKRALPLHLST